MSARTVLPVIAVGWPVQTCQKFGPLVLHATITRYKLNGNATVGGSTPEPACLPHEIAAARDAHRIALWGYHTIRSKSYGKKEHREYISPSESRLPFKSVLKGDSESRNWPKSVIPPNHAQTAVCETYLIPKTFLLSARF